MITSVEVIDEGDDYRLLVAGVPLRESVWIYSIRNLFGGIKSLLQKLFGLKSPNKVAIGEKPPVATMEQIYQEVKELDDLSNSVLDLLEEKRIDEAERVCERLQREYPEVIDGWERLGVVRVAQERWLEASQCYRKVVDLMRKDGDSEKESIAWAVGKAEKFEVMHNTSQPG
jgi:tetratricopeptide (TPR) repeat protein